MTQSDLNRAVARATGETVRTIASRGFGLADPETGIYVPHPRNIEEKMGGDGPDYLPTEPQPTRRTSPCF